jgi:Uma2 family endonuclease
VASNLEGDAMTTQPLDELDDGSVHLLTIGEYAALGETEHGYTELVEGRLLMSPSPAFKHSRAMGRLYLALVEQAPAEFEAVQELDVDLALVPADEPGSSRRPDIMVVRQEFGDRIAAEGGLVPASEVLLVVEIVSPSSKRTDHVHKRHDYADAGIPNYWIVDIDEPISLTACRLTEQFGYQDDQVATGIFRTDVPFPVEVDLSRLV